MDRRTLRAALTDFLPEVHALEHAEPPHGPRVLLYALLALVVTALVWASVSEIDILAIGRGRLVTPLPNLVVQPLEASILKSIDVRVGQQVRQGTVLAPLAPTFAQADAGQLGARRDSLAQRAQRLEAELHGNPATPSTAAGQEGVQARLMAERQAAHAARLKQYDESIARLRAALETNRRDEATLAERVHSLAELEAMQAELEARQFGSRAKVLELRERKLEVERDRNIAAHRDQELRREIAAAEAERTGYLRTWRQDSLEKLSQTVQERDEVTAQLDKTRLRTDLIRLTAPQDGVVLEIGKRSVGSVLKEAEPLFTLVPMNAPLEAEVEIGPGDVGLIRPGDTVRIKFDTYPFQKHGTARGRVLHVSPDAFSRQGPGGATTSYYLARVALDDTRLDGIAQPTLLLPGMSLTGEIVVGRRSVIAFFLYPLIRTLDESLRER
ncbi:MAG TPA: HlyD family type I secretion periplasmic adaptor subunit [Rhodocyclaceae bacterium]|nr:HlyD family type I secretion periplasmic adaptor subunit [Rhodocyclaceae bacterium]